jgi:hypothetical protein
MEEGDLGVTRRCYTGRAPGSVTNPLQMAHFP